MAEGFWERRYAHPVDANADLWRRLGRSLARRSGDMKVAKVRAHQSVAQLPPSELEVRHFVHAVVDTAMPIACDQVAMVEERAAVR